MKEKDVLEHISRIETEVYPREFQSLYQCRNYKELCDFCEGKAHTIVWDGGYCVYTKHEIVDLASINPLTLAKIYDLARHFKAFYKKRKVELNARESTSWKIIRFFELRGHITVLEKELNVWGGECFYDIVFTFT